MRPRAVLVHGDAGIGKTTFIDQLQVELLARGRHEIIVVDDAGGLDADGWAGIRRRFDQDSRTCLLVGVTEPTEALVDFLDRACERRVVELPPLDDVEARALVRELGLQDWSLHASHVLADAAGNPRAIIDRSADALDVSRLAEVDLTFDRELWSAGIATRMELSYAEDEAALDAHIAACEARAAEGDPDACVVLAERAFNDRDLEAAIQFGERAAASALASEQARLLGSILAAAARTLRGEPAALLSLHALAGRASRAGLWLVEAFAWYQIADCTGTLGDVSTSRRAASRAIELSDRNGAITMALLGRLVLANLHVAANEPRAAAEYLHEIRSVADARGLHRLRLFAQVNEARAMLLGDDPEAPRYADEALELVIRANSARIDVIDAAVIVARAYAKGGSVELALAPIDALAGDLGDSTSPDFWLVLEAVRVLGKAGTDPAAFQRWLARMADFDADGHGGALRAAHAEADAWRAAVEGRRAEAARLAERARQLWIEAECHDELVLTEPLVQQAPMEHGPRISLVGSTAPGSSMPAEDPEAFDVLTKREREIARYVAGGLTNPEIASELHLSPRTVEHHVASILRKLELPNRRALVRGRV